VFGLPPVDFVNLNLADAAGVATTLEFGPIFAIPDLSTALAALRHVGRRNFRLLIDTLHLVRAGCAAKDIAALDRDIIGYAQLCDAPLAFTSPSQSAAPKRRPI
jgi:sugar phosphate isomerase/epimerase